jgi:U4/U6 small nuclear ribonucleoprotein PRP31
VRKLKEKYAVTELRKQMNRVPFGPDAQQEFRNTSKTLGMLGLQTGKVRLSAQEKAILKKARPAAGVVGGTQTPARTPSRSMSSGATSGISSSLAFTPVQGIELSNPELAKQNKSQSKYFSAATFKKD